MLTRELDSIVNEIVSGIVISRIEHKEDTYKKIEGTRNVLTLRSITCGMIDGEEVQKINLSKTVSSDKLTTYGDIVLKLNKPFDSVYIEREYENYLIPSFCCKISGLNLKEVDPHYLVGYLNTPFTKEYLITANGASASSLLKIKDIKKLPIPLPDIKEQRAIGEVFRVCCERQVLMKKMINHEMKMAENIILESAREVFGNE